MNHTDRIDPFAELKSDPEHYKVFDERYENVGKVDDLFVDEDDRPLYIGVKTGLLGTRSTLVPIELVRVNDRRRVVEVAESNEQIKLAPSFENSEELTPELEDKVRNFFGLDSLRTPTDHESHDSAEREEDLVPDGRVDLVPGERKFSEPPRASSPRLADPVVEPGASDTEPGKEWARGTEGHRPGAEERERNHDQGHRTKARRLRR